MLAQAGEARRRQVGPLDRHRLAVGEPQPLQVHEPFAGPHAEPLGEHVVGAHLVERRGAPATSAACRAPACPRCTRSAAEAGQLRLGDEGAAALLAVQPALDDELVQGLPDRRAGGAELDGQRALGRQRAARRQACGQLGEVPLEPVVLGFARAVAAGPAAAAAAWPWSSSRPGPSVAAGPGARRAPARRLPTVAVVYGSTSGLDQSCSRAEAVHHGDGPDTRASHVMAAEIAEQPAVLQRVLADGVRRRAGRRRRLTGAAPRFVLLAARGTSDHAALYAKYLVEIGLGLPCGLAVAVDVHRVRRPARPAGRAGGRGQPVRRVARPGGHRRGRRACGATTLAVTNAPGSALADAAADCTWTCGPAPSSPSRRRSRTPPSCSPCSCSSTPGRAGTARTPLPLPDGAADRWCRRRAEVAELAQRYRFARGWS